MHLVDSVVPFALLVEVVSNAAGMLLVLTGAGGGCFRTWAVLTERSTTRIEWLTAFGFAAGVVFAILLVVVDQAWR